MPDYREIYNAVIRENRDYHRADRSPGYRHCVAARDRLQLLSGRALDVGCGAGFVCQYLAAPPLRFAVYGVDVSDEAVECARQRLARICERDPQRIQRVDDEKLPFNDGFFSLATCFDVLEHLDVPDVDQLLDEMRRVLRIGGILFGSVSCRPSGYNDTQGDNLHRTVKPMEWWIDRLQPIDVSYQPAESELTFWWKKTRLNQSTLSKQ
jgi:SAM-dependent methyltransferase